jgi:hypothetical protein
VSEVAMEQQIKTAKAYCFFYRKRNLSQAKAKK